MRRFYDDGTVGPVQSAAFVFVVWVARFSLDDQEQMVPQDCISVPNTLQNCYHLLEKIEWLFPFLMIEDQSASKAHALLSQLLEELKRAFRLLRVSLSES